MHARTAYVYIYRNLHKYYLCAARTRINVSSVLLVNLFIVHFATVFLDPTIGRLIVDFSVYTVD